MTRNDRDGIPALAAGLEEVRDVLLNRDFRRQHLPWVILTVALGLGLGGWYFLASIGQPEWPGGGSTVGLILGIVGGLIILFEFLLWPRKKKRTWRVGRVKHWMAAHIWFGLLCLPLLILHSGFRLGESLSTVLMVLLVLVVLSGVWGLLLQQFLPRQMLEDVTAETIYSQIDRVNRLARQEAHRLVEATCGPPDGPLVADRGLGDEDLVVLEEQPAFIMVGAVRSAGRVQGNVLETAAPATPVPDSEPLRNFFRSEVVPYLKIGRRTGSPLANRSRAEAMFRDLRTQLDPRAHPAVTSLENACDQRRQHDLQVRLHVWLHGWLLVHLPLSIALVVLMFVHIYVAVKYW
ncbi:hypothetical protein BH23PLA1_BH23PLA1_24600 [soil metagenome]